MLRALGIFVALLFTVVAIGSSDASARDIASAKASGKRQYKPVIVTKQTNKASPKLMMKKNATKPISQKAVGSQTDNLSDMGQQQQLRLQQTMDQKEKADQTLSNIMKKKSDTDSSVIQNMK